MKFLQVLSILCILCPNVFGYRCLAVLPARSKSHYYIGHSLMKGLAETGHEVTVISTFKADKPMKNYKEVFLEHSWDMSQRTMAKDNFIDMNGKHFWESTLLSYSIGADYVNWTMSSKNFQNFLKSEQHFDVVIVETVFSDALFGFAKYFDAPLIAINSFGSSKWTSDLVGSPIFASYVPFKNHPFTDRMTFWQRMYNSMAFWFEELTMPLYFLPKQQQLMEEMFPEAKNWPSLDEIRRNVSLVLLNTHSTLGTPRPYAPNMIEVGGMHIQKEIDPLPLRIQTFLDEAKDGAILVSLGSNILLSKLPKHHLDAIVNAFRSYPNYRILIKCDDPVVIPSHNERDVLVESWFNQQSILAHENIKLFVTHAGLLSITETVHYGKPVVGIPVVNDQHLNMRLVERNGYGISVPFEILTGDKLSSAIDRVLSNSSYSEQAKLISDRFRDQPLPPLE
ncbi:UDP-glucosyltransferase 2-like [Bradysia coprophila]|uniref:UDP-glucosyltransferase 2-like n=1 Tax=Bradysia coprophila TaxID=38358 RepID=UPI00187DC467|nr:UDP-glucosyltransferase 2-like [Bradysia coprophila]